MIRLIASCAWICAVTLTSAYVGATLKAGTDQAAPNITVALSEGF
jgi:hypothetical protein